jgi:hypothetical protein
MRWGKFLTGAVILLAVLLAVGGEASYAAEVDMTFAGVPGNGRFNSGAIAASEIGTEHATAKLYYFAGSSPTAGGLTAIATAVLVQGQGFESYAGKEKTKAIGFALAEGTSDVWAHSSVPADPVVAADGSFVATASFRRIGNTPYGASERLVICLRVNETGELIPGTAIVLDLTPTPVSFPVTLDPVTLYTGADYHLDQIGNDKRASAKIVAPDGNQYGVTGIALSDGSRAISLTDGDVWSPTNGVTATKNVDSSVLLFRTSAEGPTAIEPPETLTISGTGVQVVNDGVAVVYGFPRSQTVEIASFSLEVDDGGHLEPSVTAPLSFKVGADASVTAPISVAPTPSNMPVSGYTLTDADGSNPSPSKTLGGGLVISVDPDTGRVTFSGTPTEEVAEATYKITATTSDGRTLTTEPDLKVSIGPGDVYTASLTPSSIGGEYSNDPFWTAGHDVGPVTAKVEVKDSDGNPVPDGFPVDFTFVDKNGDAINTPWHGLTLTADDAGKTVTISGTPDGPIDPATDGVYVKVTTPEGQVSRSPIPLNIHVDPDVDYSLNTGSALVTVPVGESFETNIDLATSPAYPGDMVPRRLIISDEEGSGEGQITWNGLTITLWENMVTNKSWIQVTGEAETAGTEQFTIRPTRGGNMEGVTFTITAEVPTSPEPDPDPQPTPDPDPQPGPDPNPQPQNPDPDVPDVPQPLPDQPAEPVVEPYEPVLDISDPVIVAGGDEGDKEVDEPAVGQPTQIVYEISFDVNIEIQGINVQLPNGSTVNATPLTDNTAHNPYNTGGGSSGGANGSDDFAYYYDKINKEIIFYVTPSQPATYVYNIYYHGPNKKELKKQPVVVDVVEVNNYYTRKKSGGGGCNAGMASFVLLCAIPALAAGRRKSREK